MDVFNKDAMRTVNNARRAESRLAKATKRLSSGYRINSAADDAAGLAVSEKLRSIDRGLRQGLRNISDGINYIDTVDGASQQVHNMLHRMKEIAVEAANGTLSRVDRDALDLEYQQLIDEIGQTADTAEFNGIPLFERHYPEYEKDEGVVVHDEPIIIDGSNDTLVLGYTENGEHKEYTVNIPAGQYTVEELADVIDTDLFDNAENLIIGVNEQSQLTIQCEGGKMDYISGDASSLFYDTVIGSSDGYLLGVTNFKTESSYIEIVLGHNDIMRFRLGNEDDTIYEIKIDPGKYTRSQLVDKINDTIAVSSFPCNVEAVATKGINGRNVIGLKSEKTITGLSGNFIKIDGEPSYSSPIYDICCYSTLVNTEATFNGKKDISAGLEVERGRNDYFVLDAGWYNTDGSTVSRKLRIDLLDSSENLKTYANADQLLDRIKEQLEALDCPIVADVVDGKLKFTSLQYGKECKIKLDTSDVPSGYMEYDLFDSATLNVLGPSNTVSDYTPAKLNARKNLGAVISIPASHNHLSFTVGQETGGVITDHTLEFDIPAGNYTSSQLNTQLNNLLASNYPDLKDKLYFSVGSTLTLAANGLEGSDITKIRANNSTAYGRLIYGAEYYDNIDASHAVGTEKDLVSYGNTVPGTGRPNVTSVDGKTVQAVTYKDVTLTSKSAQSDNLLKYTRVGVQKKTGSSVRIPGYEDEAEDDSYYTHYSAEMTIPGAMTRFSAVGVSLEDTDLSFDLSDKDGNFTSYNINIPAGKTADEALNIIRTALSGVTDVTVEGNNLKIVSAAKGKKVEFKNESGSALYSASKSSLASDPAAVVDMGDKKVYKPATLTLPQAGSHIPLTVGADNDRFKFTACGINYNLQLTHGTYSSLSQVADEINTKIAAAGSGTDLPSVKADGSSLVITAPLKSTGTVTFDGSSTCKLEKQKIVTDVGSSGYFNPITGNAEYPATIRAEGAASHFPLTVNSGNNQITMDYTSPDPLNPGSTVTESLTITVPDGSYSSLGDYVSAINSVITSDPSLNGKITASNSGGLTFTTVGRGQGYKLSNLGGNSKIHQYKTTNSSAGGSEVPSENKIKYPAYISNNRFKTLFDGDGVEINDTNNFVSLKIDGADYKFSIPSGEYVGSAGQTALISALNTGLSGEGVTVSVNGNELRITTDSVGTSASISLNADNTAPYFKRAQNCSSPQTIDRASSPCHLIGSRSISSIEIEDYFNEMKFTYTEKGSTAEVTVAVPPGSYTADTLAAAIQAQIDTQFPPNSLIVGTTGGRITITGADISDTRGISNFSGRLYDRVFQSPTYSGISKHTETSGTSTGSAVSYIIGRNELQPESPEELESEKNMIIYSGLNDEVVFDFTYKGVTYKVDFTVPAGEYMPEEMAQAVEKAGREAMHGMIDKDGKPIVSDYFHATIGLGALGVEENDNVAIKSNGKLVLGYVLPDNGTVKQSDVIIDGIRGNSAYRIFYDATQSPRPSRVIGKSDLSDGILIRSGENDTLSVDIDGKQVSVTVPAGSYTCKSLSDELNKGFEASGAIVRTSEYNGHLMFYTTENGAYQIDRFTGNAADDLFYGADKRDDDEEIGIHTGRRTDSYIMYNKTRADDHLMRINTTGVTTVARALKAIDRLDHAVNYLSGTRAVAGAIHNRAEHTYSRNQNYIENLEEAESGIRDADIPEEIRKASKERILMQMQNYMLEKQSENKKSVLDLLG